MVDALTLAPRTALHQPHEHEGGALHAPNFYHPQCASLVSAQGSGSGSIKTRCHSLLRPVIPMRASMRA
jgi:hypothetical protein